MAVDPYVPLRPEDAPRASVAVPPAGGWRAVRPGDLPFGGTPIPGAPAQPNGCLFGSPGPDSGYALTLAGRFADRLEVVAPETVDDAMAVGAELAMKRASIFGRAPVATDLEVAFSLFGWLGGAPPDLVEWRRLTVAGAHHDYPKRRALLDGVPDGVLRRRPDEIRASLANWRELIAVPALSAPHPNG